MGSKRFASACSASTLQCAALTAIHFLRPPLGRSQTNHRGTEDTEVRGNARTPSVVNVGRKVRQPGGQPASDAKRYFSLSAARTRLGAKIPIASCRCAVLELKKPKPVGGCPPTCFGSIKNACQLSARNYGPLDSGPGAMGPTGATPATGGTKPLTSVLVFVFVTWIGVEIWIGVGAAFGADC